MEPLYHERLSSFRDALSQMNTEAYLVTKQEHVRYISGFSGDSTWLLITGREKTLFTDGRYTSQAALECPGWEIIRQESGLADALKKYREQAGFSSMAVDGKAMSVEMYQRLSLAMGSEVALSVETDPCYALRKIKDPWEFSQLSQAFSIADRALFLLRSMIRPGLCERDIALEMNYQLCKCGADDTSFSTIVAAGPQGALPHAKPGDYRLATGDFVTIDFGALVNGYHSDMTRTFILGKPDKTMIDRYNVVLEAQERALAALKPGVSCRALDAIARDYLTQAGYGEYFGHGLGHSFGLEIHESPRCGPYAEDETLSPGMTMTVEPGVYIPDWGGLRIEDSVIITERGKEVFTRFPKTLEEIIIR